MPDLTTFTTHRRGFLGRLAAGAAALGLPGLVTPTAAAAQPAGGAHSASSNPEFEAWLNKMTGKHKMVFDVPEPNNGYVFAWARIFLNTTNETYGTTDADNTVAVVLRHESIPFGMKSEMWAKYRLGEHFKINEGAAPATRNGLAHANPGELPIPGMALDELVAKGVLFGICNMALTFYSGIFAKDMGMQAETIKKDWVANLLPGVTVVPSGVIAVNRSQEKGCAYCFAG
jgi:intracellular sulfur oxidation DsrE/DsrF family protein